MIETWQGKEEGVRERESEWENKIESSMFTFYFPLLHSINDGNKIELFSFRMALYKLHLQREKKWLCGNRITNNIVIGHRKNSFIKEWFFSLQFLSNFLTILWTKKINKFLEKLLINFKMKILVKEKVGSLTIIY